MFLLDTWTGTVKEGGTEREGHCERGESVRAEQGLGMACARQSPVAWGASCLPTRGSPWHRQPADTHAMAGVADVGGYCVYPPRPKPGPARELKPPVVAGLPPPPSRKATMGNGRSAPLGQQGLTLD